MGHSPFISVVFKDGKRFDWNMGAASTTTAGESAERDTTANTKPRRRNGGGGERIKVNEIMNELRSYGKRLQLKEDIKNAS